MALWPVDKSLTAIGGLFGIASEVIALALGSSPQSLNGGLVVLSSSYTAADTETRRAALVSAAEALIAATNAVSWGGILTAAGILVLSVVMRRPPSAPGSPSWGSSPAPPGSSARHSGR